MKIQQTYLADAMLVKVDRASMAVGLEIRVPLQDQRVVEFAFRITEKSCILMERENLSCADCCLALYPQLSLKGSRWDSRYPFPSGFAEN
jgi:hypothetical protein